MKQSRKIHLHKHFRSVIIWKLHSVTCRPHHRRPSKSVSKEGHVTLYAQTVSRPYLSSRWSVVSETSHAALLAHAPQSFNVWSKSASNEGHFISWIRNSFLPLSRLALQRCDWNITCGTPFARATFLFVTNSSAQFSRLFIREQGNVPLSKHLHSTTNNVQLWIVT
jgi:hypothetical protein